MEVESDLVPKDYPKCEDFPSDDDKNEKKKRIRRNIIRLTFDGLAVLFLGMQASQKGPAFLDLQSISGTDVEKASSYFTFNSFGYMVGALLAGFLYDKLGHKVVLICIPLTLASIFIGLTPLCTSYITMLLAHMASASQCSISETAITAEQFHMWGGKSDSAFQFLSFTYSLGGVFGPLYTEPFLAPKWNETDQSEGHEQDHQRNNISEFIYSAINSSLSSILNNQTVYNVGLEAVYNVGLEGIQTNFSSNSDEAPKSQLFYAYLITGLFGIIFSIPFYIYCFRDCSITTREKKESEKPAEIEPERLSLKAYVILTAIGCFFLFMYTMIEDSFNMFLSMFVVSHLSWTKENGALISSMYWGIGTASKLISVPVVRRVDVGILLLISCVGMVISMTAFVISSHYHIHPLIWVSSSIFAMSQSPLFGGSFSWIDTHILRLDGKATSATMISASSGAMVGPFILGITMENISLMVFPYIELINTVITLFYFIFLFFFLKPYVTLKYGPVRPKCSISTKVKNETELDEQERMVSENGKGDDFANREINGTI